MGPKPAKIHIGSLIREPVREAGMSVKDFADAINRSHSAVYDIFNRPTIDIDLLCSISKALGKDFLALYQSEIKEEERRNRYLVVKLVVGDDLPNESGVIFKRKL